MRELKKKVKAAIGKQVEVLTNGDKSPAAQAEARANILAMAELMKAFRP